MEIPALPNHLWEENIKKKTVNCLAAQVTLAIMNFNFTIERWEIIHDQFV